MMTRTKGVRQFAGVTSADPTSVRAAFLQWASGLESSPEIVLSFELCVAITASQAQ
jgi:hypothetical protein